MPEYLAPGVYIEEVSFRSKSIEGVSTTTTGFVGPTLYGPTDDEHEILTSLADFERTYGPGRQPRSADADATLADEDDDGGDRIATLAPSDVWHAARAFFDSGGSRLYVKRVYRGIPIGAAPAAGEDDDREIDDGRAATTIGRTPPAGGGAQAPNG